jgi:nucleoside-triphosphatase THEP1
LSEKAVAVVSFMASLEFFPRKALGTIMLNPHPFADEIKLHPEVEVLLVTRDNRTEVMKQVLTWLTEREN